MGNQVKVHAEVVSLLRDANNYGDDTKQIDIITSHGSMVFLGRSDVYKIKLPVKYPYMNFSTLKKRKVACEREFHINYPRAPSIYIGVKPITKEPAGNLAIDGSGEPIEWAVHMRRFPEKDILKNLTESSKFDDGLAANLGNVIADYHNQLPPCSSIDGTSRVSIIIDEILSFSRACSQDLLCSEFQNFSIRAHQMLDQIEPLLDQRAKSGLIRRCHGDLHLNNIVLIDEVPTLFDALEFDEQLATVDVIYDFAFLLMDLIHVGLKSKANIVFNSYLNRAFPLTIPSGFRILPLFLGLRAAIRSMVNIQSITQNPSKGSQLEGEAGRYISEANLYLEPAIPTLVAVGGFSGTGKSTLAAALASEIGCTPGAVVIRSDIERKNLWDVDENDPLPSKAYRPSARTEIYSLMLEKAEAILTQGHSVILDAAFLEACDRRTAKLLAALSD